MKKSTTGTTSTTSRSNKTKTKSEFRKKEEEEYHHNHHDDAAGGGGGDTMTMQLMDPKSREQHVRFQSIRSQQRQIQDQVEKDIREQLAVEERQVREAMMAYEKKLASVLQQEKTKSKIDALNKQRDEMDAFLTCLNENFHRRAEQIVREFKNNPSELIEQLDQLAEEYHQIVLTPQEFQRQRKMQKKLSQQLEQMLTITDKKRKPSCQIEQIE